MKQLKKLPIGIQTIKKILENRDYVYVDKTHFAYQLIQSGMPHYFLSRPRRFGKSLFLSTLKQIFRGNKELFKGCGIYKSDYDWEEYPILYFDFSQIESSSPREFKLAIGETIEDIANEYDISVTGSDNKRKLTRLIKKLSEKNHVAILVDEYDHPIINNLKHPEIAEQNRDLLKGFFETLKTVDECIKLTFITGVSKFSQVSIFSGLNNLKDITMDPNYAAITGYTEEELENHFQNHIEAIAQERSKKDAPVTCQEIIDEMRLWYNGYRFSSSETCVYNPFSTLNYIDEKNAESYWYASGTPSFLIEELKKHPETMISLDGEKATKDELIDSSSIKEISSVALMYQTGYFTIKDYNEISKRYVLGLPNEEVRTAFMRSLVKAFSNIEQLKGSESLIEALKKHNLDFLFEQIEIGFASFAYQVFTDAKERTYQGMLLAMLYGMGFDPLSERSTNTGRIDVVLEISETICIIELKLNKSADSALKQIHEKQYFKPYTKKGKSILIVGAKFSSKLKNISDWKGELLSESGEVMKEILPNKKKKN